MAKTDKYVSFLEATKNIDSQSWPNKILKFASELPSVFDQTNVQNFLEKSFDEGSLSTIKDGLNSSIVHINEQIEILEKDSANFVAKLTTLKNNISKILNILEDVIRKKMLNNSDDDSSANTATLLNSYDAKVTELKDSLDHLDKKVTDQANGFNDKLFSLTLNTIAILGIFVAIAFAGFSAVSIFSELNIDTTESLLTNTFYLFLVCLFVYNLLFLLLYFVFRIVQKVSDSERKFKKEMVWFLIIDAIILLITILLFVSSLVFG